MPISFSHGVAHAGLGALAAGVVAQVPALVRLRQTDPTLYAAVLGACAATASLVLSQHLDEPEEPALPAPRYLSFANLAPMGQENLV